METTLPNPNLRKAALTSAAIWAAINIALFLIVYYMKPDLMGSFTWAAIQFFIGLGLAIYFCLDLRKKAGGYWTFKDAFGNIFLMFFVQALIVYFFTIFFARVIEPEYIQRMKTITENTTTQMMEKMGVDQDKIDQALADNNKALDKQFSPGPKELFVGLGTVAIMYCIGALIFAAIFKKDPPIFVKKSDL